jgi:hypothetical protein
MITKNTHFIQNLFLILIFIILPFIIDNIDHVKNQTLNIIKVDIILF